MSRSHWFGFLAPLLLLSPPAVSAPSGAAEKATPANTLTAAEKAAGWRLLWDGVSSKGWRQFKGEGFPARGWLIKDGVLVHEKAVEAGDIITEEKFDNFDLRLEFRLSTGANSGLKYLVDEALVKQGHSGISFEYQFLDDENHPDAKLGKQGNRTCGALYDLIAPSADRVVRPVGNWNEARVLVDGNHVEHWLNGKKVVAFDRGSAALKALIAESKYKTKVGFGEASKGHLLLQDHNDEVAFRNIKVRTLPSLPRR